MCNTWSQNHLYSDPCTHARDHLRDTRNEKNLELAIGKSFSVGGKSFTYGGGKNLQRGLKMEHLKNLPKSQMTAVSQ